MSRQGHLFLPLFPMNSGSCVFVFCWCLLVLGVLPVSASSNSSIDAPLSDEQPLLFHDNDQIDGEDEGEAGLLSLTWLHRYEAPSPPPHNQTVAMARFIVHQIDWTAMATLCSRPPLVGRPFASLFSVCDGPHTRSTGVPYMYLSSLDVSVRDLEVDNRASLTMSLAQTGYCKNHGLDPESPLCAHVILNGRVVRVPQSSSEYAFAKSALFARHPGMRRWPANHHFFVAKLDIEQISLLDFFGGMVDIPVVDYFKAHVSD